MSLADDQALLSRVNAARIADDLWNLVRISSPTCHERTAALVMAQMLREIGLPVEVDQTIPESPSVIARLKGNRPGRTFQLAGHIDHVNVPHAPPQRHDDRISGRGSADMKNGLAAILEAVRVLREAGCDFPGEILVTVYGLHEAPDGDSSGLMNLIRRGIHGDAALVAETTAAVQGKTVIAGKGQSVWTITIERTGAVCHELNRPTDADGLLATMLDLARSLRAADRDATGRPSAYPLLGNESVFIGQAHYGDFYNRAPAACRMQGTWRWLPDKRFADVQDQMRNLIDARPSHPGISARCDWLFVGEAYQMDPREPVLDAYRAAAERILGFRPPDDGCKAVVDGHRLVPEAGVPTVLCGSDCVTAHADYEFATIDGTARTCRLVLLTAMNYLHAMAGKQESPR